MEIEAVEDKNISIFKRAYSQSRFLIKTLTKFELGYVIGFTITGFFIILSYLIFLLILIVFE